MSLDKIWLKAKVIEGKKLGRTLGYPTLNLDQPYLLTGKKEGVYACKMKIGGKLYHGALYYGPRLILKEKNNILEIFVFDFTKNNFNEIVVARDDGMFIILTLNFNNEYEILA